MIIAVIAGLYFATVIILASAIYIIDTERKAVIAKYKGLCQIDYYGGPRDGKREFCYSDEISRYKMFQDVKNWSLLYEYEIEIHNIQMGSDSSYIAKFKRTHKGFTVE